MIDPHPVKRSACQSVAYIVEADVELSPAEVAVAVGRIVGMRGHARPIVRITSVGQVDHTLNRDRHGAVRSEVAERYGHLGQVVAYSIQQLQRIVSLQLRIDTISRVTTTIGRAQRIGHALAIAQRRMHRVPKVKRLR